MTDRSSIFTKTLIISGLLLYMFRVIFTQELMYGFLFWNVFLAFLPVVFAKAVNKYSDIRLWFFLILWLLFLPNSFYILTDLGHVTHWSVRVPVGTEWYSAILVLHAAIIGVTYGLRSMDMIYYRLGKRFSFIRTGKLRFYFFTLYLCSFGVFLGRVQRWNSWDILTQPESLLLNASRSLLPTHQNLSTLSFICLFWLLLLGFYVIWHFVTQKYKLHEVL